MAPKNPYPQEKEDDVQLDFDLIKYINKLPYTQENLIDARRLKNLSIAWPMGGGGNGSSSSSSSLSDDSALAGLYTVGTVDSGADYETVGSEDNLKMDEAIVAANLAGAGTVYVLPGEYIIANLIHTKSGVSFIGSGIGSSIIRCASTYNATSDAGPSGGMAMIIGDGTLATHMDNVTISGFTWDMNEPNLSGSFASAAHHIVDIWYTTNFRFHNNKLINGVAWDIFLRHCEFFWIEKNFMFEGQSSTHDQHDGIHVRGCQYGFIRGNYVNSNGSGNGGDDCIVVANDTIDTQDTKYIVVTDNIVSSQANGIVVVQEGTNSVSDIVIANNNVYYAQDAGIRMYKVGSASGKIKNININGNVISNYSGGTTTGDGIVVEHISSPKLTTYYQISITNNTIRDGNWTGGAGISVTAKTVGLEISNNQMYDMIGLYGIRLGTTSCPIKDIVMSNNRIDLSSGASGATGILLYGTQRSVISGNQIYGHVTGTTRAILLQAKATAGNDSEGIANAETSAYNNIYGNSLYTWDYSVVEESDGDTPNNNQIFGNHAIAVSLGPVLIGSNSRSLDWGRVYAQGNVTGATTFNRANGDIIIATLTGNITVTLTNGVNTGDRLVLKLIQDATGGRTATLPSNLKQSGTIVLSTAASAVDVIEAVWDGTNWIEVSISMNQGVATRYLGSAAVTGNTASGGNTTLFSTSHATKGKILFGTSVYDEVNNRLGINNSVPISFLDIIFNGSPLVTGADNVGFAANFSVDNPTGQNSTISLTHNGTFGIDKGGVLGFGGRFDGTLQQANWASIKGLKHDATSGNYGGYLSFFTRLTGSASAERMRITSDGRIYGTALHNNAGGVTGSTFQYLASGTYTPTLTNVANLDASTAYLCQWIRVGNVVTVSGRVDIDPTTPATSTQLGMTLPIVSDLGSTQNCAGTAFASGIATQGAAILADTTNDRAQLQYICGDVSNQAMYFSFTYTVL